MTKCRTRDLVLRRRNDLEGQLDAEIPSGRHDSVTHPADFVDAFQGLWALYFCNDQGRGPDDAAYFLDVARSLHERDGDELDVLCFHDLEVSTILLG